MRTASLKKYEDFHNITSIQKSLIKDDNFTYRLIIEIAKKYVKPEFKILDVGSGAGTLALYFGSKGNNVLGIEISKRAVSIANQSAKLLGLKNVKFIEKKFPEEKPDRKFDCIIFTEVIEHLEDDNEALKQIYKLLNKGGIVLISTPSKNAPLHRLGYARGFDKRVGHLRRYTEEELTKKCAENGLVVIETKKIEGVLRNFLFLSPTAGKLVRFIKFFFSDIATFIDNLTVPIFGESNIIVVARKK